MLNRQSVVTFNSLSDKLLIIFPLWFPLLYFSIFLNFPSISKLLFIFVIFAFAETHFASTWLFFLDKENWQWLKKESYKLIFIPLYLLFLASLIWIFNPALVIVIHYLASGWHVTRQSIGVMKLFKTYTKDL